MKTTHETARELLSLPNVKLTIEGWCDREGYETTAVMTEYDPEGTAIKIHKCASPKIAKETLEMREQMWMYPSRMIWKINPHTDIFRIGPKSNIANK